MVAISGTIEQEKPKSLESIKYFIISEYVNSLKKSKGKWNSAFSKQKHWDFWTQKEEKQCFGAVCWNVCWEGQEKQGQIIYMQHGCKAGMLACLEQLEKQSPLPPSPSLLWAVGDKQPCCPTTCALLSWCDGAPERVGWQALSGVYFLVRIWQSEVQRDFRLFWPCSLRRKYSGGKDKNKRGSNEVFSSQGFSALNWCS